MFKGTTKEFGNKFDLEYAEAQGLLKFLEKWNIAKNLGKAELKGKGKPSILWEVPIEFTVNLESKNEPKNRTSPKNDRIPTNEKSEIMG